MHPSKKSTLNTLESRSNLHPLSFIREVQQLFTHKVTPPIIHSGVAEAPPFCQNSKSGRRWG